jgi:hypothetical protein
MSVSVCEPHTSDENKVKNYPTIIDEFALRPIFDLIVTRAN